MKRYKTSFSESELQEALHANDDNAKELLNNPDKWSAFKLKLDAFIHKAYKLPVIGGLVDDIVSMIQIVDAYVKKEYRDVPWTTMLSIVGALIYILSPIDLIPDAIPFAGYLDDAAVVLLVLKLGAGHDLEKFKKWQDNNRDQAIKDLAQMMGKIINALLGEAMLGALIVCENDKFRVLAVDNVINDEETPYNARVHYLNTPIETLKSMFIESEEEILEFFKHVIEESEFKWSPIGKLEAVHEADFNRYDDYFALVEDEDFNE